MGQGTLEVISADEEGKHVLEGFPRGRLANACLERVEADVVGEGFDVVDFARFGVDGFPEGEADHGFLPAAAGVEAAEVGGHVGGFQFEGVAPVHHCAAADELVVGCVASHQGSP